MTVLSRVYRAEDVMVRADGGRHYLSGVVLPWDRPEEVRDEEGEYVEVWRRGAFKRWIHARGRCSLFDQHNHATTAVLGASERFVEEDGGLWAEFKMLPEPECERAARAAVEGALGFSVGFQPVPGRTNDIGRRTRERTEARLREVSLTPFAIFHTDPPVLSTRAFDPDDEGSVPTLARLRREATLLRLHP
jgi:HK97 family phage prohead protease